MSSLQYINPIRKNSKYHQGYYLLENPNKLIGYYNKKLGVIYRSGLELAFIKILDLSPKCIRWSYESDDLIISYHNPVKQKICSYYPDFYVEMMGNSNKLTKYIIEVKSKKDTEKPDREKYKTKKAYLYQLAISAVTEAKRKAAVEFCKGKDNLRYEYITEDYFTKK